jgi:hypothetical protein
MIWEYALAALLGQFLNHVGLNLFLTHPARGAVFTQVGRARIRAICPS